MRPINVNLRKAKNELRSREVKLTNAQIAAHLQGEGLDVGDKAVGHWFSGRNKPPVEALRALADILQTEIAALIAGDPAYVEKPESRLMLEAFERLPAEKRQLALALLRSME